MLALLITYEIKACSFNWKEKITLWREYDDVVVRYYSYWLVKTKVKRLY